MRTRTVSAAAAVVIVVAIPLVTWSFGSSSARIAQVDMPSWRDIHPSVFASGQFVHGNEVRLTSEVIGKVKTVYVSEGQAVARGDLLLLIDDEAYAAQLARHRAAVRLQEIDIDRKQLAIDALQRQHGRSERLYERELLDTHAFEAVAHQLRLAHVDLASSRELLAQAQAALAHSAEQREKTRAVSPIAGVVTSLDIEAGETAIAGSTNVPGSVLMVIADPRSTLAEIHIDEADVSDIHVGQTAEVVAVAYPERPLAGSVAFVANTARYRPNGRSLSFRVRIRLADGEGVALKPGMSCRAEVFTAPRDRALSVPIPAIVSEDELATRTLRHFVYVVAGAGDNPVAVRKAEVTVGRADDEFQEIVTGVSADERIVVGPSRTLRQLRDGDLIEISGTS